MRISKLLPAGCALALLMGFFSVRAGDTPAQAAARAALLDKMAALDAQQSQSTNAMTAPPLATAPVPAAAQPAAPVTAAPETTTSPPTVAPASPPVVVVTPSGAVPAPAEPPAHSTPVAAAGGSSFFTPVPPPSNPSIQAIAPSTDTGTAPLTNQPPSAPPPVVIYPPPAKPAAPTAVAAKKTKVAPAKPAAPAAAPVVKPLPQADLNYAGKSLGFKPVEAPPPPISEQKVAKLQALLARYMANQISPDEYQKERATILAEP